MGPAHRKTNLEPEIGPNKEDSGLHRAPFQQQALCKLAAVHDTIDQILAIIAAVNVVDCYDYYLVLYVTGAVSIANTITIPLGAALLKRSICLLSEHHAWLG